MSRRPSPNRSALSVILAAGLLAAFEARADTSNGELTETRSFIFSEEAVLYESPSESSAVVCTPPIGSEIVRLATVDIQHTSDGIPSNWMQGACELDGETFQGYIPRSWLALTWQELGSDTLLLFGVDGRSPVTGHFTGVAKVLSGGRMLWGLVFTAPDIDLGDWLDRGSDVSSEQLDPAGLSGVDDLVLLSFTGDAHGDEVRDHNELLAWTGWCLVFGISAARIVEDGVVRLAQEILLPGTDPSRANLVGVVSTREECDEEVSAYETANADTTTWTWDGIGFSKRGY